MALDANIILRGQAPQFDNPMDVAMKGMNMRQLANSNLAAEKAASEKAILDAALKQHTITGPDGKVSIDQQGAVNTVMKQSPQQGMTLQKQFEGHDLAKLKNDTDAMGMLFQTATPENAAGIKAQAMRLGITNADKLPDQWTPEIIKGIQNRTLSMKEQLDQAHKNEELNIRRQELGQKRNERQELLNDKKQEKEFALSTPYGLANTVEDAKNLKSVDEVKKNFDSKLAEMIQLRTDHDGGAIWNRNDVRRGKQLSNDLLLAYKDLSKLGVLSISDEKILRSIIPEDPLAYNEAAAAIQGQDPILHSMKKFKDDSESDFQNRMKNRLRNPGQAIVDRNQEKKDEVPIDEYQKAYKWALANPKHPNSKAILDATFKVVGK